MLHWRLLVVAAGIVLLTQCGFSLRGGDHAVLPMERLSVSHPPGHYPLAVVLQDALRSSGVHIPEPGGNDLGLRLSPESLTRRAVSINTRARAGQYELELSVDVSLVQGSQHLAGPETFVARGVFFEDTANISGSNAGMELVLDDMRRELTDMIIRRLQSLDM